MARLLGHIPVNAQITQMDSSPDQKGFRPVREGRMLLRTALVSAVLISVPLPTPANDIYSHLRDERGASCCDDQDCRPAFYRLTTRGVQMYVDQQWIDVPEERIQYRALPGDRGETGGGHWCG